MEDIDKKRQNKGKDYADKRLDILWKRYNKDVIIPRLRKENKEEENIDYII